MAVARAQGVELIGEYEDSGFKEPPYLARRSDGQVVQMSKLLFAVAEAVNGSAGFAEIAERASKSLGKQLSAEQAQYLVDKKLRPLGLLANPDGSTPRLKRMDPMLALNFRAALVPEGVVRAITVIFRPLFSRSSGKCVACRSVISRKITPLSRREMTVRPSATASRSPDE